jgi:hypothetical protein
MADIELVIKIPEETYEYWKNHSHEYVLAEAIKNGTPLNRVIKALEQTFCKNAEYEKDLNELKEQILKDGDTLLTKRDLLERFCEIDKEYNGRPWNLLQILSNINILIGEEPCEDCISRAQALSDYADWYGYGYRDNAFYKHLKDMPPATPKQYEPQESEDKECRNS